MKVKRNLSISGIFKKTVGKMFSDILYGVLDQLDEISVCMQIVVPFLFWRNEMLELFPAFVLSCVLTLFTRFLTAFHRDMQGKSLDDIPVPLKRFTRRNKAGFIEVSQEDGAEITKYLYDIEEYLEKKGLIDRETTTM